MAKSLLSGNHQSGCQSLIIILTDGLDFTPGQRCREAYLCNCDDKSCSCCQREGYQCPEKWDKIAKTVRSLDEAKVFLFNVNERQREFRGENGEALPRPKDWKQKATDYPYNDVRVDLQLKLQD